MKKIISILLAVMLVVSVTAIVANAYSVNDPDAPDMDAALEAAGNPDTNRYYFQMPNGRTGGVADDDVYLNYEDGTQELIIAKGEKAPSWFNDFTDGAGIYWWGGPAACSGWAGYKAHVDDADQNIFYADVPSVVTMFVWNNGVDGGEDKSQDIYYKAAQIVDLPCEYPDPDEFDTIPEGDDSFDGYIYIVDPNQVSINEFSKKQTCGGLWYVYYGNGCYGSYTEDSANFKSVEENCVNPDHFDENGNHVGFHKDEPTEPTPTEPTPTEPAPTEPTPTEPAPTEPAPTEPAPTEPIIIDDGTRGDADGDGERTIFDVTLIQRHLADLSLDTTLNEANADADGDGMITIFDATRIQRFLAKMCNIDGSKPYVEPVA